MNSFSRILPSRLKSYQKLTQKKYREKEGKFIIEGVHLVEEALHSDWNVEVIVVTDAFVSSKELLGVQKKAHAKNISIIIASEHDFRKLADTITVQGVVGIVHEKKLVEPWNRLSTKSFVVVLDGISDPGNVGTIIRTCDWFGIDAVILGNASVELYNPKVLRSAMGSIFHLPVMIEENLTPTLEKFKRQHWKIVTTVVDGGEEISLNFSKGQYCFVFGNEARGVSKEIRSLADLSITIPKFGQAESLNVAVSCGVILSQVRI